MRQKGIGDLDPEEILNTAARLVLAGALPSVPSLAEAFGVTDYWVRRSRAKLIFEGKWPYRHHPGLSFSVPNEAEVRAACERLGLPHQRSVVIAEPRTSLAERVAEYRREWREGVNFLATTTRLDQPYEDD